MEKQKESIGMWTEKSFTPSKRVLFAEYVLAHFGGYVCEYVPQNKKYEKECERLQAVCEKTRGKKFSKRIFLLEAAGDCITSQHPRALWLKASAYISAGAACRRKMIMAVTEYLCGEMWCEHKGIPRQPDGRHSYDLWIALGDAYLDEKEHDKAIIAYHIAHEVSVDFWQLKAKNEEHLQKSPAYAALRALIRDANKQSNHSLEWHGIKFKIAEAYMLTKDFDKAVEILEGTKRLAFINERIDFNIERANRLIAQYKLQKEQRMEQGKNDGILYFWQNAYHAKRQNHSMYICE